MGETMRLQVIVRIARWQTAVYPLLRRLAPRLEGPPKSDYGAAPPARYMGVAMELQREALIDVAMGY